MGRAWVLTGPIGSGKSTVAEMLSDCGATRLDADAMSHRLLARHDEVHVGLRRLFGEDVFGEDGRPRRDLIGDKVFSRPELLRKLEKLLHPFVLTELGEAAAEWRARKSGLLVMEVVIWFQQPDQPFPVDGVLMTWAPTETLIKRVGKRSGLPAAEVKKRLAAQGDWEAWNGMADRILNTDCPLEKMRKRVRDAYRHMLAED